MKFEVKLKGTPDNLSLVFDDKEGVFSGAYEITLVKKEEKGASVAIGTVDKQDLKRLAKAS